MLVYFWVNKHCDDFKLAELCADNFKYLIFVQGLVSTKDAEIRQTILNKLENEPNITQQQIAEDCQKYLSVKQDSKKIEESGIAHVREIRYKKKPTKSPTKTNETKKKQNILPPNPWSGCGALHWYKDFTFRNKKCFICNWVGHKSLHCRSKNKTNSYIKENKVGRTSRC